MKAQVERRHLEEAARIVKPRCTQEGMRVFCLSPTPQIGRVAQALADAESRGRESVRRELGECP